MQNRQVSDYNGTMAKKDVRGRPTKYHPSFCDRVVEHMSQGLSLESFAAVISCNPDSLYEWQKKHPHFSEACKKGKAAALRFWEEVGKAGIIFGEMTVTDAATGMRTTRKMKFRADAWKFWMQARFGWKERLAVESDSPGADAASGRRKRLLNALQDDETLAALDVLNKKLEPQDGDDSGE